jgi:hypothetical protein
MPLKINYLASQFDYSVYFAKALIYLTPLVDVLRRISVLKCPFWCPFSVVYRVFITVFNAKKQPYVSSSPNGSFV